MRKDKPLIDMKARQLIDLTAAFCSQHLDDEYAELCEKIIRKMARKRTVPFLTGKIEIWAAGIVYALGQINFLFDRSSEPHATADDICDFLGTKKSTTTQKAKNIRDMLKLTYWDDDFSTGQMAEQDPFRDMVMVNGLILPRSMLSDIFESDDPDEACRENEQDQKNGDAQQKSIDYCEESDGPEQNRTGEGRARARKSKRSVREGKGSKTTGELRRCGLCGKSGKLVRTECCGRWICDDADQYELFSYARNSCYRNHDLYTLCAYHHIEGHDGSWKDCAECRDDFETEMYVWHGTNEYNFEKLENPPEYEPTRCDSCGEIIRLTEDPHTRSSGKIFCMKCGGL